MSLDNKHEFDEWIDKIEEQFEGIMERDLRHQRTLNYYWLKVRYHILGGVKEIDDQRKYLFKMELFIKNRL